MLLERIPHVPESARSMKGGLWSLVFLIAAGSANAQVSSTAYRVLGQHDLRQSGSNMIQGGSANTPLGIAIDVRGGEAHLYVSDTGNARILAWRDIRSYEIGEAPALVLGQPDPQHFAPLGIGPRGLAEPVGLAVAPSTGDLYVADHGNNRILRFPAPFDNPGRIEPDAVYGQPNFTTRTAAASASSLNQPRALAFDSDGNLWVSDSGNNRVLRFAAASLGNSTPPAADTVLGQRSFDGSTANAGGGISASGLDTPAGLVFDSQNNLYVCDFRNARVLKFAGPVPPGIANPSATAVWGQTSLTVRSVQSASAATIAGPAGIAFGANRDLYVAVPGENRILVFSAENPSGSAARTVIGQPDFTLSTPNSGAAPLASSNSLSAPADVKLDPAGNLFVADSDNHRVLQIPATSKSASRVWGQNNFVANGVNQVKPGSLNLPYRTAIDYSAAPFALYVSDTRNNRVLVWRDAAHFRNGDPADLVIGQPDLFTGAANADSLGSQKPTALCLSAPAGIAVDPNDGTLYVADSGNNRVLRYRRPVSQSGRIRPNGVYGQPDFTTSSTTVVGGSTFNRPLGVAVASNGSLFVADTGNNRVLQFAPDSASAIRVFGQPNMNSTQRPAQASAQTLAAPQGLAVDQGSNLYVADVGANRILVFPNTDTATPAGAVASFVIGQSTFSGTGTSRLKSPSDVAIDSIGNVYIADAGNNRVLAFQSLLFLPVAGAVPSTVIGQADTGGVAPNWDSDDGLATGSGLYAPTGLYVDRQDTLYVADAGNNRVLHFLKPATAVNAATMLPGTPVARGSLATLFGQSLLTDVSATMASSDWPKAMLNRELVLSDQLTAPIYYIDSRQANFQVPSNAPSGAQQVAVRVADTGELVAGGTLLVAAAAPGIFTVAQSGAGQAAALNENLTPNSAANPATVGSTIVLYGTGQGQVSPAVSDGVPAGLSNTVAVPTADGRTCLASQPSMCVAIGGAFGVVRYSGLAPGFVGLWQINVSIPQGIPAGPTPVRVVINGVPSNVVNVVVR